MSVSVRPCGCSQGRDASPRRPWPAVRRGKKKKDFQDGRGKLQYQVLRMVSEHFFSSLCPAWTGHSADASARRPYPATRKPAPKTAKNVITTRPFPIPAITQFPRPAPRRLRHLVILPTLRVIKPRRPFMSLIRQKSSTKTQRLQLDNRRQGKRMQPTKTPVLVKPPRHDALLLGSLFLT